MNEQENDAFWDTLSDIEIELGRMATEQDRLRQIYEHVGNILYHGDDRDLHKNLRKIGALLKIDSSLREHIHFIALRMVEATDEH